MLLHAIMSQGLNYWIGKENTILRAASIKATRDKFIMETRDILVSAKTTL